MDSAGFGDFDLQKLQSRSLIDLRGLDRMNFSYGQIKVPHISGLSRPIFERSDIRTSLHHFIHFPMYILGRSDYES